MPWHKPKSRMGYLVALVAIVAFEIAILPGSISKGVAGLTVVTALIASVNGAITRIEWAVIIAIHLLLITVLLPAVKTSHFHRRKPLVGGSTAPP